MSSEEDRPAAGGRGPRDELFEALVKRHRRELTRFAVRQLGEHAGLAEDVVQEALLNAHRAIAAGACPEHPRAWLFTIVRNAAVNATRSARTTDEIEERRHGTADQTVAAAVEQSEWIGWLMGAVHELPARQREALVGHAFEGRSYREIAARQQTTIAAVKSLLTRARRTLSEDASLPAIGLGAPLAAGARALRALRVRGLLAGKAGGAKGLAGALAQAVLAATVTTGVLMAVHAGGLGSVLASTGPARAPDAEHTGPACRRRRRGTARRASALAKGGFIAKRATRSANACAAASTDTMARPRSSPPLTTCRPTRSSTPNATANSDSPRCVPRGDGGTRRAHIGAATVDPADAKARARFPRVS